MRSRFFPSNQIYTTITTCNILRERTLGLRSYFSSAAVSLKASNQPTLCGRKFPRLDYALSANAAIWVLESSRLIQSDSKPWTEQLIFDVQSAEWRGLRTKHKPGVQHIETGHRLDPSLIIYMSTSEESGTKIETNFPAGSHQP